MSPQLTESEENGKGDLYHSLELDLNLKLNDNCRSEKCQAIIKYSFE
jgi:hypothetical protein